mmetsp:Transcript_6929/g.17742  ORF Transcript_6929/g.17742 Transcript_6929/m.17742 type:complete len:140 (-) Transcript_6929:918-1337(-)
MSRRVEDQLGADAATAAAIFNRPARKQPARPAHDYDGGGGGGHNIWYHNKKRERRPRGVRAPTRCVISRDAGRTRADWAGIQQLCVYFAQGCCTAGQNCTFLHRAPTEQVSTYPLLRPVRRVVWCEIVQRSRLPRSRML